MSGEQMAGALRALSSALGNPALEWGDCDSIEVALIRFATDRLAATPVAAGGVASLERWLGTWADSIPAQAYRELLALQSGAAGGVVVPSESLNGDLCEFARRWLIDGDYMRCRNCNRPQIATCAAMEFPHAPGCKDAGGIPHPWQHFAQLIQSLAAAPQQSAQGGSND